jgi:hypothetical protein
LAPLSANIRQQQGERVTQAGQEFVTVIRAGWNEGLAPVNATVRAWVEGTLTEMALRSHNLMAEVAAHTVEPDTLGSFLAAFEVSKGEIQKLAELLKIAKCSLPRVQAETPNNADDLTDGEQEILNVLRDTTEALKSDVIARLAELAPTTTRHYLSPRGKLRMRNLICFLGAFKGYKATR